MSSNIQTKVDLVKPKDLRLSIMGVSPDYVFEAASNLTVDGFLIDAYKLLQASSIFDKNVLPKLSQYELPPFYRAIYMTKNNEIVVNSNIRTRSKPKLLEILAHEFRHAEQIFNGLRLDKYKEENLIQLAKFASKGDKIDYHNIVTKMSPDSIKKLYEDKKIDDKLFNLAIEGCELFDRYPEKYSSYERSIFEKITQQRMDFWQNIQNTIIKHNGELPAGSKAGKYFKKLFDSAMQENKVGLTYFFKPHERDAYLSGIRAKKQYKSILSQNY